MGCSAVIFFLTSFYNHTFLCETIYCDKKDEVSITLDMRDVIFKNYIKENPQIKFSFLKALDFTSITLPSLFRHGLQSFYSFLLQRRFMAIK